jgi:TRAP-type C4-dicarboxylate transport system permease small subunit
MDTESLWLGPARQPMRLLMIGLAAAVGLVWLWLLVGVLFLGSDASMASLIRPEGNIVVKLLLWLIFGCAITTGLYLSDTRGMIEVEATGPMDILSLVLARITMVAIAVTVCVMFYEVVARYIFSSPTLWANELSLWIAGFTFLLAGLYAMQQRSHIRIYIIYDMMPWWAQKLSDCVTVLLIWVFFISLVWGGYNEVIAKIARMETFGTAWDPPLPSTVKAAILIVIGLVAVQALSNLIADWNKAPVEHTAADEIDEHEIELLKKTLGADDNG